MGAARHGTSPDRPRLAGLVKVFHRAPPRLDQVAVLIVAHRRPVHQHEVHIRHVELLQVQLELSSLKRAPRGRGGIAGVAGVYCRRGVFSKAK